MCMNKKETVGQVNMQRVGIGKADEFKPSKARGSTQERWRLTRW